MTDEQKARGNQRQVYIDDDRWEKVERRKFNLRANGDKQATHSSIVRQALREFFEKMEGDKA